VGLSFLIINLGVPWTLAIQQCSRQFSKIGRSGLDRTEKFFVFLMCEDIKILYVIRFYRFAR